MSSPSSSSSPSPSSSYSSSTTSPEYISLSRLLLRAERFLDDPGGPISAWNRDTAIHRREYLRGTHRAGFALPGTGHAYARPELLASEWLNVGKEVDEMEVIGKRMMIQDEGRGERRKENGKIDVGFLAKEEKELPRVVFIFIKDEVSGDYEIVEEKRREGGEGEEEEICFIDGELLEEEEEENGEEENGEGEEGEEELCLVGGMIDLKNNLRSDSGGLFDEERRGRSEDSSPSGSLGKQQWVLARGSTIKRREGGKEVGKEGGGGGGGRGVELVGKRVI